MSRNLDIQLGILATGVVGLVVYRIAMRQPSEIAHSEADNPQEGDESHYVRFAQPELVWHFGACHCTQVKFRVQCAPALRAVDVPSKIRFPRLTVPVECLELMSDQKTTSSYRVQAGAHEAKHMFCSCCGTQVCCIPRTEAREVYVNADCLDRTQVTEFKVVFMSCPETVPFSAGTSQSSLLESQLRTHTQQLPMDMSLQWQGKSTKDLEEAEDGASLLSLLAYTGEKSHNTSSSRPSADSFVSIIDSEEVGAEERSRTHSLTLDNTLHHQLKHHLQRHMKCDGSIFEVVQQNDATHTEVRIRSQPAA